MLVRNVSGTPEIVDETTFRRSHKNVSFPPGELPADLLAQYDAAPLRLLPKPALAPRQRARRKAAPEFVNGEWVHDWEIEDVPVTPDDVAREAERRMELVAPSYKVRAAQAEAAMGRNPQQQLFQRITAIRDAAEALESMDPIPRDFADNKHWP